MVGVLAFLAFYFATRKSSPTAPNSAATAGSPSAVSDQKAAVQANGVSHLRPRTRTARGKGQGEMADDAAPQEPWAKEVDEILLSEAENKEKSAKLFALIPQLNGEAQVEVAGHLANLVSDKDYADTGRLLTNATMSTEVLKVLFQDVMNRGNELKLPLLLDIARTPNHPIQEQAKGILEVYLQEDHGTDWAAWQATLQKWLKENIPPTTVQQ